MRFRFACAAAVVAVLALPQAARADDAVGLEVAAKGGFKTNPGEGDPVHPGLGARAGVSISRWYFGLGLMYYLHADMQVAPPGGGVAGGTATLSSHDLMVGLEVGYEFRLLDVITLRPQIGYGVWTISSDCHMSGSGSGASCIGDSVMNAYVEPGVTALLLLGGHFLVGADANGLVLPVNNGTQVYGAFSLHAQAGVRF